MTRYERVPESPEASHYSDDEIDLRELFVTLWAGKWIIILTTIIFAAAGVAYALYKPNTYQASALLAPAQNDGSTRIGGELSGLASLAGVNLGGGDTNKTTIAKEVLQSRAFLADFILRHQLAAPLVAAESWNQRTERWEYDQETYNPETGEWLLDENGKSLQPTSWELVEAFREQLAVSENKDNGMVTVSFTGLSPQAAKQWVGWLVGDINEHMRAQDVEEAEASVTYLEGKLEETTIAGMQQVFYQLIEQETRTIMLANAQRGYVFKTIDPPVAPQEKAGPKRGLIVILATILGIMLATIILFIRLVLSTGKAPK
ncbi:Wzz/FepE/Etk N-terminal domain-containing protein [Marinobacter salarius]|uniref:Wzz/FepE/Etk N-terminal domain-containing protein n=1 Tax=Marinobacter salarius TaxID=1420917 RepID=UPI003D9C3FE0